MLKLSLKKIIYSITFLFLFPSLTSAQVIPDKTLGGESSTINSIDELRSRIEGGAIRGENLFHSFEEFSVQEGLEVYFANHEEISNIFSRVTGNNISEIFGTLGVEGAANLFLINPNGIVFGKNATVDIGGSFIATTAERVLFEDGRVLEVRDRDRPILTWNAPIGLGLEENSGEIIVRGEGHNLALEAFEPISNFPDRNISIKSQQNIALLGRKISLDGAILEAENGKIALLGVNKGQINIDFNNWTFAPDKNTKLGNIILDSKALVNSSGNPGGSIELRGNEIFLENGSSIVIQNRGFGLSGTVKINSNNLEINEGVIERQIDENSDFTPSSIATESIFNGKGGNINIHTVKLSIMNGGQIQSTSFNSGNGGDITIEADTINASGSLVNVFSSIRSAAFSSGNGGSINIFSGDLSLIDGGSINSTTFGSANAGNINSRVSKFTTISGFVPNFFTPSSIITTSLSKGNTGQIDLSTTSLVLSNAGTVISLATSAGNAGRVTVNASESIQVENRIFEEPILASAISSSAEIVPPNLIPVFGIPEAPSGNAGDLFINTSSLKVSDGGLIAVRNTGTGSGGEVNIQASEIVLETRGEISASALLGEGGNIILNSDRLSLNNSLISASAGEGSGGNITITSDRSTSNNSLISAEAGTGSGGNIILNSDRITTNNSDITAASFSQRGGNIDLTGDRFIFQDSKLNASAANEGDGGNVTIDADGVLGFNSDITATAERGDGGNVTIDADGVLGFIEANAIDNNGISEVDVTSRFGTDGVVVINNPLTTSNDPIIALNEIPRNNLLLSLAGDCYNNEGEPLVTDSIHEDLPEAPDDYLDYSSVIDDEAIDDASLESPKPTEPDTSYYPADTAIQTEDGRVYLVNKEQLNQLEKSGCLQVEGDLDE